MMTISEAQSVLHCPNAYGGIYGKKYGQALEVAFRCMEACEGSMTVEEYRQRMIQAFHNADCDSLIAIVSLPSEKEFEHLEWLLQTHYKKEPCEDAISREAVIDMTGLSEWFDSSDSYDEFVIALSNLPPVTPQPKTGRCKDCKHFEYDSVAKVDGVPLIVAHEICSRWGDGCKTSEDGYCFLFEPKMQEVQE